MSSSNHRVAKLFLRYAPPLAGLRHVPVLGPLVHWASGKIIPRDSLEWLQIQQGPAQGIWMRLNLRTGRDYFGGGGEPELQTAMLRYLRPGMTFYDIGANIGFFSLLAARIVGTQGRVVAFEADPEVAQRLRDNVQRNCFSAISVEEKAVWSETRPVFFSRTDHQTSPDRGLGHVVADSAASTIQIEAISLDDFLQRSPAPHFVKCDVEGAEVEVVRGARRLLKEKHPIFLCEIHSDQNRRMLLEELAGLGYNCESLDQNHILALAGGTP